MFVIQGVPGETVRKRNAWPTKKYGTYLYVIFIRKGLVQQWKSNDNYDENERKQRNCIYFY